MISSQLALLRLGAVLARQEKAQTWSHVIQRESNCSEVHHRLTSSRQHAARGPSSFHGAVSELPAAHVSMRHEFHCVVTSECCADARAAGGPRIHITFTSPAYAGYKTESRCVVQQPIEACSSSLFQTELPSFAPDESSHDARLPAHICGHPDSLGDGRSCRICKLERWPITETNHGRRLFAGRRRAKDQGRGMDRQASFARTSCCLLCRSWVSVSCLL